MTYFTVRHAPTKIPYAIDRCVNETNRLYGVLNKRLADREFIAARRGAAAALAALCQYHAYLILLRAEPMTSADRQAYREERSRVATRLAFL